MRTIFKLFFLAASLLATTIATAETPGSGYRQPYADVTPMHGDELVVIEFFKFSCPVCRLYQPIMENWAKTLPNQITFKLVPVYEGTESSAGEMKMYLSMNAIADPAQKTSFMDSAYNLVQGLHQDNDPKQWRNIVSTSGISIDSFASSWNAVSSSNASQYVAQQVHYRPTATPTLVICGRYMLTPDNVMGNQDLFIRLASALVSKCMVDNGLVNESK